MNRYVVITTCNAQGFEKYGMNMVQSFLKYWPKTITLLVLCEGFSAESLENVVFTHMPDHDPEWWLTQFKSRHAMRDFAKGYMTTDYNFKYDAVRFSHKVATIGWAHYSIDLASRLIWMDADCITHSPVTIEWLDGLMADDSDFAWLNRKNMYPECGFMIFNRHEGFGRNPRTHQLIHDVIDIYKSDEIFKLKEWHDSFVIQQVAEGLSQLKIASLSGEGHRTSHPLINGPLGACFDHLKGDRRKDQGRSEAGELRTPRTEGYWQR